MLGTAFGSLLSTVMSSESGKSHNSSEMDSRYVSNG
jgi:hypothetical protein